MLHLSQDRGECEYVAPILVCSVPCVVKFQLQTLVTVCQKHDKMFCLLYHCVTTLSSLNGSMAKAKNCADNRNGDLRSNKVAGLELITQGCYLWFSIYLI